MATVEHPVSARTIERKFAQMEGTRSRPIGPAPTPEAATKHQQDNTKRIKMLRDAYSAKHERLMKQTAHLANVKRQVLFSLFSSFESSIRQTPCNHESRGGKFQKNHFSLLFL